MIPHKNFSSQNNNKIKKEKTCLCNFQEQIKSLYAANSIKGNKLE